MKEASLTNFGLVIAYLLPGFTALWGISFFSPTVKTWLTGAPADAPTLGGFLYATIGSIAAGLTVSTVRWILIDTIHHATGIQRPNWDFAAFHTKVTGYDRLTEIHYQYYQFYANMLIAVAFTFVAYAATASRLPVWTNLAFILFELLFWLGSRDTLRKYYTRGSMLLGRMRRQARDRG